MSLVMQPLVIKDEVKQENVIIEQPNPVKIPIPVDTQLVSQAKQIAQTLSAAATSTSSSASLTQQNTSQQGSSASISNQQTAISAPTQNAQQTIKASIIQSTSATTPTLKTQKSFNPTESYLSNFTAPPVNPTQGTTNGIVGSSNIRIGSNGIGSSSIFSSLTTPFKPSQNSTTQPIIAPSNNTSTSSGVQANNFGDSADVANFTNHIFSQPYLFYQSNNMNIPQLEVSMDDLYTVFTFIVPNKPYPNNSTNSQLQKNNSSSSNNNNSSNNASSSASAPNGSSTSTNTATGNANSTPLINNSTKANGAYTSYNSSNNLSSLSSNSNTPIIQHSSLINASSNLANSNNTTTSSISPNGFQKSGEGSNKSHRNSFSSATTTPKVPHFGLSGQNKEERKSSAKGQSLVDLIKQQCNPEDEKRKKSDSIPTFNNLGSGFKSNFNSSSNLGSLTQLPIGGLSQTSITSLLNLSLNHLNNNATNNPSGFNPVNSTNFGLNNSSQNNNDIMESEEALAFLQQQIKQEQQQQAVKQELQIQESQSQLNAMADEEEEKVVMPDSNDDEDEECEEEAEDDDKKSGEDSGNDEDEEARLIREIKEMKKKKAGGQSMFAKNFKKDGSFLFGGEGQDGDIFDFCEEKLGGGSKKQKKNGSGGHKNKFDTKNLVKNFLNSFISFAHHPDEEAAIIDVLGFESSPQLNDFRSNLRNFFKGKKFNRVLLKEFIFEDLFRPLFLFFLENRALNWIESGRMKDKASHLRALKNFIFVCQHYDQIKSWRFRYNFVQN
ncbi:hypothetical protein ABPG74_013902 [Tetrahymena malaccensis]